MEGRRGETRTALAARLQCRRPRAGDPDVSILYAIQGYPTKIVVDPEGKIAKIVVGEDPAFYEYLDELFK